MSAIGSAHPMSEYSTGRIALLVTLGTESVFFVTLLVAYAALRAGVEWDVPHTLPRLALPLANSVVLLLSAVAAWWSGRAIARNKQRALRRGLVVALLLGLLFVAGQAYEFSHAGLQIDDQAFGGVFFTLLGCHAAHVLAGIVFLGLNLGRATMGDFTAGDHEAVELGNLFWFYLTAVWAVLFAALYLL